MAGVKELSTYNVAFASHYTHALAAIGGGVEVVALCNFVGLAFHASRGNGVIGQVWVAIFHSNFQAFF